MLVTPESNRRNRRFAITVALVLALLSLAAAYYHSPAWLIGLPIAAGLYYLLRRTTRNRLRVMKQPFPDVWEQTLQQYVTFFVALDDDEKARFRNLVKVFLDEVTITGIRTDVDEATRTLVAASAVIPIFGLPDWEYSGLGEVLIYPNSFDENYRTEEGADRLTLGMVGVNHLSGVMILAKPTLIAGFRNDHDKKNVGIHEFAHLVDKQSGDVDGVPPGIPKETYDPWVRWVGREIRGDGKPKRHINDYAYTNEAEYFAVLSEYFFEAPEVLQKKDPKLYKMLQSIYRQNTRRLFKSRPRRRKRVRRNDPCPCGSGEKYKRCCRTKMMRGMPK